MHKKYIAQKDGIFRVHVTYYDCHPGSFGMVSGDI